MKKFSRMLTWFLLITKKYFRDIGFLLTFFAIPFLAFSINAISGSDEAVVRVAMYAKPDATASQKLMEQMVNKKEKAIMFYKVDSMEQLEKDVKSGYATSGFELPDDLEGTIKKYVSSDFEGLQFKRAIAKYYYKSETNYTSIACELFFAGIYPEYARAVFADSVENREETSNLSEADWEEIDNYYNSYIIDDKLFLFENMDGTLNKAIVESKSFLMLAVRGLIYSLVLLAAMLGALAALKDERKGVFDTLPYNRRYLYTSQYVLIPPVFTGVAGLLTMICLNVHNGVIYEIKNTILFILLVFAVATVMKMIFRNIVVYATLIPLFVMVNVLLCNVFVDVSMILPYVSVIRKALPLYYALTGFQFG